MKFNRQIDIGHIITIVVVLASIVWSIVNNDRQSFREALDNNRKAVNELASKMDVYHNEAVVNSTKLLQHLDQDKVTDCGDCFRQWQEQQQQLRRRYLDPLQH